MPLAPLLIVRRCRQYGGRLLPPKKCSRKHHYCIICQRAIRCFLLLYNTEYRSSGAVSRRRASCKDSCPNIRAIIPMACQSATFAMLAFAYWPRSIAMACTSVRWSWSKLGVPFPLYKYQQVAHLAKPPEAQQEPILTRHERHPR